jgi:hypothetical protein
MATQYNKLTGKYYIRKRLFGGYSIMVEVCKRSLICGTSYTEQIHYVKASESQLNELGIMSSNVKSYGREDVIEIVRRCLNSTGKEIKAEMKGIGTGSSYIEFDGNDLDKWTEKNI